MRAPSLLFAVSLDVATAIIALIVGVESLAEFVRLLYVQVSAALSLLLAAWGAWATYRRRLERQSQGEGEMIFTTQSREVDRRSFWAEWFWGR